MPLSMLWLALADALVCSTGPLKFKTTLVESPLALIDAIVGGVRVWGLEMGPRQVRWLPEVTGDLGDQVVTLAKSWTISSISTEPLPLKSKSA